MWHRGVVQALQLFIIYTHDFDANVGGMVYKFAEDTKIDGIMASEACYRRLQ